MHGPEIIEYLDKLFWAPLLFIGANVANQIKKLNLSVQELNTKVAVVLVNLATHEKRIDRHEEDIEDLKELKARIHVLS